MRWFRRHVSGERRYWQDLLARLGVPGVNVREITQASDGHQVHCRLRSPVRGGRAVTIREVRQLERGLAVHKRLPRDGVRIEEAEGCAADFIIYITDRKADGSPVIRDQAGS